MLKAIYFDNLKMYNKIMYFINSLFTDLFQQVDIVASKDKHCIQIS